MTPADLAHPRIRVAAVIVENDTLLLALHEKSGQRIWVLPGGGVVPGETMTDALRRELREELGLEIIPRHLVHLCESIDPRGSRHLIQAAFLCDRFSEEVPRATGEDPRVVDARFMPLESLASLIMHPPIQQELAGLIRAGFLCRLPLPINRWTDG